MVRYSYDALVIAEAQFVLSEILTGAGTVIRAVSLCSGKKYTIISDGVCFTKFTGK